MPLLIARRPVFDSREQIFAYDLAVRGDADATGLHQEVHPEQLLAEVFLETGVASVAGAHRVFVATSHDLLVGGTLRILPADRVILQIPPAVPGDSGVVSACQDLVSAGYQLAVDVDDRTELGAALGAANVIRVDVSSVATGALADLTKRLRAYPARLLATNVPHRGERDRCAALGFDLFEGYRFSAPVSPRRDVGVDQLRAFRVLRLLRDPKSEDRDIEALVQGDVGLAYKLLRMVNNAAMGGREIWSIGHALRLLGREHLARWLSVLLVSDTGSTGVRAELAHLALVRARMCECVATLVGVPRAAGSLFLVGMFSVLDQLLEVPMADLCAAADLAPDLRNALLHRTDLLGSALGLVEAYVSGRWDDVEAAAAPLGVVAASLQPLYLDALGWAASQDRSQAAE